MKKQIEKVRVLFETLPYIKKFAGTTVVVKYGGSAMVSPELKILFAEDMVFLKYLGITPPSSFTAGAPRSAPSWSAWGSRPVS